MDRSKPLVVVGDDRLKQQLINALAMAEAQTPALSSQRPLIVLGGRELARYRRKHSARLRILKRHACVIVALETHETGHLLEAIGSADGLVFNESNLDRLPLIVELAASGYLALPEPFAAMLLSGSLRRDLVRRLSPAECRVLGLLGRGSSNRSIGDSLRLDEGRTKYLIRSVLKKLRLHNRTQAAVFARDMMRNAALLPYEWQSPKNGHGRA